MAKSNKSTYPTLPVKQWWELRKKAVAKVPTAFNSSYIATTLGMKEESAKANIMPAFLQFGIIDDDGKPTQIFHDWRDDTKYPELCKSLLHKIYPSELVDAIDPKAPDRSKINNWFLRNAEVGSVQAGKMTQVFLLLLEADPAKQNEMNNSSQSASKKIVKKELKQPKKENQPEAKKDHQPNIQAPSFSPAVHIDLQIHISPDSSTEQINKIFESISKHLFKQHKQHEE